MSDLTDSLKDVGQGDAVIWTRRPEVLLCGNVPKPLHGVAPRVVLGAAWWQKERVAAFRSTDDHCVACGVHRYSAEYHQWLEGHELYDVDWLLGRMTYLETVPLCHFCHSYIHDGRLKSLLDQGKVHHAKYANVIQHGDRVLKQAKLKKLKPYQGPFAEWEDWRLVIGDKEYPPLYKNEVEWKKAHHPLCLPIPSGGKKKGKR